jgi:hypothetical protein
MNKIRNVHSPAGMPYSMHGVRLRNLRDCPKCKYGTLDFRQPEKAPPFWECADCHARFTEEELKAK